MRSAMLERLALAKRLILMRAPVQGRLLTRPPSERQTARALVQDAPCVEIETRGPGREKLLSQMQSPELAQTAVQIVPLRQARNLLAIVRQPRE